MFLEIGEYSVSDHNIQSDRGSLYISHLKTDVEAEYGIEE